jgi:mitogen-activated protein kinase organizer 1
VRLWNPYKGTHINTYRGHGGEVRGLAISRDNTRFVTCGSDRQVNLFDVVSGVVIRRFVGHDSVVNAVQYAADEALAVSVSYDATVRFWDLKSRSTRPIETVKVASDSATSIVVSENSLVLVGSIDGSVTTMDVRQGVLIRDELHQAVTGLTAPADGMFLVAACTDSTVRLLDRKSGHLMAKFTGHTHTNYQLECTLFCDDAVIACGSEDGEVPTSMRHCTTSRGQCCNATVNSTPSPKLRLVTFSVCYAGSLYMWSLGSKEIVGALKGHHGVVTSVSAIPSTSKVITGGADCTIKLWT